MSEGCWGYQLTLLSVLDVFRVFIEVCWCTQVVVIDASVVDCESECRHATIIVLIRFVMSIETIGSAVRCGAV